MKGAARFFVSLALICLIWHSTAFALTSTVTTVSSGSLNNASSYRSAVTLTAKVSPSSAAGVVTFKDGTATLGTRSLSGGKATLTTASLAAGTHSNINAVYGGDAGHNASTSLVITQTVSGATTPPLAFAADMEYGAGSYTNSVAAGDFNGDGKLDLATANWYGNSVSVLPGSGDGTFAANVEYGSGSGPISVTAGDFNGDGKPDLATASFYDNTVSVLLGNGDGTFAASVGYAVGISPCSVVAGDFNGDGKLDIATANLDGNSVSILLGNGDGTFAAGVGYAVGSSPCSVVAGDFNGDGELDLAIANSGGNNVSVLLGNGDGTFSANVEYTSGSGPISVTAGDFNGDGKPDLATASYYDNTVSVLMGHGDGTFAAEARYAVGCYGVSSAIGPYSVTTGDFNGDGKLDIAEANSGPATISVLPGNGDGTFTAHIDYGTGLFPISVTVGDFNKDGKLDIATANANGNSVSVLLGNSPYAAASAITAPADGATFKGASCLFTGTATAVTSVSKVEVSTDGGANWHTATGKASWSYAWTLPANGTYTIKSRATDSLNNVEPPGPGVTVTVDKTAPTSTITFPPPGATITGPVAITGTASDGTGSGVKKVEVSINGGAWTAANGTTSWSYDWTPPAIGPYTIKSRATDNAGNVQATPASRSVTRKAGTNLSITSLAQDALKVTLSARLVRGLDNHSVAGKTVGFYDGTVLKASGLTDIKGAITKTLTSTIGTHTFTVKFLGDAANAPSSDTRSGIVIGKVMLDSPANGGIVTDPTPTLLWTEFGGADKYHVQVATATTFGVTTLIYDQDTPGAATALSAATLTLGKTYYWRVQATIPNGKSIYSDYRKVVYKYATSLALESLGKTGSILKMRATLTKDDGGAPVPGKTLTFYENTNGGLFVSKGTAVTGGATSLTPGIVTKTWTPTAFPHNAYVKFLGDATYAPCQTDPADVSY